MRAWLYFLILITIAIYCSCTPIVQQKRARISAYAETQIHNYELKQTKLPSGTIPTDSPRVLLGDSTVVTFSWTQRFETVPFEDQEVFPPFGTSSDTITYVFSNGDVTYDQQTNNEAIATIDALFLSLTSGEYQFQLRNSIWDAYSMRDIWSQWSNPVGLYIDIVSNPMSAPKNVTISL